MAVACLPMYDLPELRAATDAWWAGVARALQREGISDVPERLMRDGHTEALWQMPDLLLSQTCGYNIVGAQAGRLTYVATPCFIAPGCTGPLYSSFIVVPKAATAQDLEDLRGTRCVVNGFASHSGCNALRASFAPFAKANRFFSSVKASGGHALSLGMLADGEADVAAIDCVTYALLARYRPEAVEAVRIIGSTGSAPVGPYVTRADTPEDVVARLRAGLLRAIDDPDLKSVRGNLLIAGFEILPDGAYNRIIEMEAMAQQKDYQDFKLGSA